MLTPYLYRMIGNGTNNVAQGMYSFVGNGGGATTPVALNNRALADFSFIGSGEELLVDASAHFSAIVSGQTNTVSGGYMHSVIAGGVGNTINGSCSAILGGSGNTVNHDWAGVFGCNVASAMSCGFHANEVVIQNIQAGNPVTCAPPAGAVTGQLYFIAVGVNKQLWIA